MDMVPGELAEMGGGNTHPPGKHQSEVLSRLKSGQVRNMFDGK